MDIPPDVRIMQEYAFVSRRKKIQTDEKGSIEGLPLQLMIIGLIASLGTAVIVGWISSIETPRYIGMVEIEPQDIIVFDPDGDGIYERELNSITLKILDTAGKAVENAKILLEGEGINNEHSRFFGTTGSDGIVTLWDVSIEVTGGQITTICVLVSGQEIANEYRTEILVIPE